MSEAWADEPDDASSTLHHNDGHRGEVHRDLHHTAVAEAWSDLEAAIAAGDIDPDYWIDRLAEAGVATAGRLALSLHLLAALEGVTDDEMCGTRCSTRSGSPAGSPAASPRRCDTRARRVPKSRHRPCLP